MNFIQKGYLKLVSTYYFSSDYEIGNADILVKGEFPDILTGYKVTDTLLELQLASGLLWLLEQVATQLLQGDHCFF